MNLRMTAMLCALGTIALSVTAPTGFRAQASGVDPAAVGNAAADDRTRSASCNSSACTRRCTLEDLLDTGQRVGLDVAASVIVRRPNKTHAEPVGELIDQVFYYDGKTLTFYLCGSDRGGTLCVCRREGGDRGVRCDHLAFSRPNVDFQVWVAEGDQPCHANTSSPTRAPRSW